MQSRRLFIGIPIGDKAIAQLETFQFNWQKKLQLPDRSLVSKLDFHLTLHFLGAVEEKQVGLWVESLERHSKLKAFSFELNRFLAFPELSRARVITLAGPVGNSPLSHLFYQMAETVERLGSKVEERVYVPHVTLFRARELKIERPPEVHNPVQIQIANFALYESQSQPGENRYRVLKSYELMAASRSAT